MIMGFAMTMSPCHGASCVRPVTFSASGWAMAGGEGVRAFQSWLGKTLDHFVAGKKDAPEPFHMPEVSVQV